MRPEDLDKVRRAWPAWAKRVGGVRTVGLLSPSFDERDAAGDAFPGAAISVVKMEQWNLDGPSDLRFDVVCASSVFMHSPCPDVWMRNVLASCRYFFLQDNVLAKRDPDGEFAKLNRDGQDQLRFSLLPEHPTRVDGEHTYDLPSRLGARLLEFEVYPCFGDPCYPSKDVIALIRGDL